MNWIEDYYSDLINLNLVSRIHVQETGSNDEYKFAVHAETMDDTYILSKSSSEEECRNFMTDLMLKINSSNTPKRQSRK